MPRLLGVTLLALLSALAGCAEEEGPTGPVPGLPPTLLGVQPGVVRAGGSATIRGLNFADKTSANQVTFGDLTASVTSASETSLSISLPAPSELPCRPTRRVPLRVDVAGRADTLRHRFAVAPRIGLTPGEFRAFVTPNSGLDCQEFPATGDEFLVSVFNAAKSPGTRIGFQVTGQPGAGEQDTASASVSDAQGVTLSSRRSAEADGGVWPDGVGLPPALRRSLRADPAHRRILETNRRLAARGQAGRGGGQLPARRANSGPAADQAPPEVGDHVQIRVPDLNAGGSVCENFVEVTGRVAHVTEHAVLLSDTANPIDGQFDDRLRAMGEEFERRGWPVIRENFGNPLRLDDRLNNDGRLYMMFTPEVNKFGNVLAFVFTGDFFPRQSSDPDQVSCASSDTAEVFYSRAPTEVNPDDFSSLTATAGWQRILRSTLVHEVKHLTSYAERLAADLPFESIWLEESTAHMAEELYARRVFGFSQGSNAQYESTVGCAVRPTGGSGAFSQCERGSPFVLVGEFVWLGQYLRNVKSESPINPGIGNPIFRGAGWWLLRWAVDHAPTSEAQFLKAMTTASETGIENVEARSGRSWSQILADWTLSLAVDDREGSEAVDRAELRVPSWDVRDIYAGFHEDFGQPGGGELFDRPYPLNLRTESYGAFTYTLGGLHGGSAALFRLVGRPSATQLVELSGGNGGPLPPFLRMSAVRLR